MKFLSSILFLFFGLSLYGANWPETNSWTPEYLLSNGAIKNLSYDNNGSLNNSGLSIAVFTVKKDETSTTGNIFISERSNSSTWSAPVQINSQSGGSYDIARFSKIDTNSKGQAVVVWATYTGETTQGIYVSYRDANGVWSSEQRIDENSPAGAVNPQVSINESGEAVVSWFTFGDRGIYVSSRSADGEWNLEKKVSTTPAGGAINATAPIVKLNNEGLAVVIWGSVFSNKSNVYASSRNASGTWSSEQQVNATSGGSADDSGDPDLSLNNEGEAIAVWRTSVLTADPAHVYTSLRNANGQWGSEEKISELSNSVSPEVVLNDQGEAIATWYTNTTGDYNIYAATRSSNGTWSNPEQLSNGASMNLSKQPQVSLNSSGDALLIWYTDVASVLGNIYVSTKTKNGSWSAERQINSTSEGSYNISTNPKIFLNSQGEGFALWETFDQSNQNIYTSSFFNKSLISLTTFLKYSNVKLQKSSNASTQ